MAIPAVPSALGIRIVFAGIGFFVAIGPVLVDYHRRLVYLVATPSVGIQIVLFVVLNWPGVLNPGGIGDKLIQTALIFVLVAS